jgi:ribosomal protein S20
MPVIISAKKKLRADLRKQKVNQLAKRAVELAIKNYKSNPSKEGLKSLYSALDVATKKGIVSRQSAARKKSLFARLLLKKAKAGEIEANRPTKTSGKRKQATKNSSQTTK